MKITKGLKNKADVNQENWITPTFLNSWVSDATRITRYRKRSDGVIEIKGWVSGGTVGQPMFTLPDGYRPPVTRGFVVWADAGYGRLYITNTGDVIPFNPATTAGLYVEVSFSV